MPEAAAAAIPAAPEAAPTPEAAPVHEVTTITNWRDSLPDEIKANPSLQDVNDVETLAKRFIDTKAMVGGSIRIPSDEAGAEAIAAMQDKILEANHLGLMKKPDMDNPDALSDVYSTLGKPEDAAGYSMPEGADANFFGEMANTALELNLTDKQMNGMAAKQAEYVSQQQKVHADQRAEGISRLQGEWGPAFDEKVGRSAQVVKALGGHPVLEEMMSKGEVDADTLRFLDNVATQLGTEGSQIAGQLHEVNAATVDELKGKRDDITQRLINDKNISPVQREEMQKRVVALSEQILASAG